MKRKLITGPLLAVLMAVIALAGSADEVTAPASADPVSTPGRATGGGYIIDPATGNPSDLATLQIEVGSGGASLGGKANFGFVVQFDSGDPAPTGNLTYHDRGADLHLKATSFNLLVISGTHATFTGQGTVNGTTKGFQVDVDDNGEPGSTSVSPDRFDIQIQGGYTASGPLIGGNIQVHAAAPPLGVQIPIDHIVVLMQENRSFDHYLGQLRSYADRNGIPLDVEPAPADASNPDPTDPDCQTNPNSPDCGRIEAFHQTKLCDVADVNHSWNGTHEQINNGAMDGFTKTNARPVDPTGSRAMGYYTEQELPFYYGLYSTFAMADRYFSSVPGPTFPNRFYLLAGTSWVQTSQNKAESRNRIIVDPEEIDPRNEAPIDPLNDFAQRTIFNLLDEAGISWKIYYSTEPRFAFANEFAYVRNQRETNVVRIEQYFIDAAAGTLPQVAFIDPIFTLAEAEKNVANDEHPPSNVQVGQKFVADAINALMASPNWRSSAFFLIYDEHGGYYDHVPPPAAIAPDNHPPFHDKPENDQVFGSDLFDLYGIRAPAVVVSPFAKKHFVSHVAYDHTSVLRFIETRFGLPALTDRDATADPMLDMFDFQAAPFRRPPVLPAAPVDLTRPECLDP